MITVLHRGGPENDYSVPRILGYYIRNIISLDLTKSSDLVCVRCVGSALIVVKVLVVSTPLHLSITHPVLALKPIKLYSHITFNSTLYTETYEGINANVYEVF